MEKHSDKTHSQGEKNRSVVDSYKVSSGREDSDRATPVTPERVKIEITSQGFGAVDAASILNHSNVKNDLRKLRSSKLAKQIKGRRRG